MDDVAGKHPQVDLTAHKISSVGRFLLAVVSRQNSKRLKTSTPPREI
jgi:hypothetical protein